MSKEESKDESKVGRKAESKAVNVDEAVEFYSKKWSVSKEEAAEKIMKLLESRKAPSMEDLFPEPLGEFSKKVQDINQAVLSTAYTRKRVADLDHPPKPASGVEQSIDEAVQDAGKQIITSKLTGTDPIRQKVDEALGEIVGDAIKDRLKGSSKEEMRATLDALLDEFGEKIVKPLSDQVLALTEKVEGKGAGKGVTTDEAVEMVLSAQQRAKELLKAQGYSIESVQVSKEDVKKMLDEEATKFGVRLASEKEHWEQESGTAVEVEKQRIVATENILTNVFDRVMDVFLLPIKDKIQEAIDKGAFRGPG